MRIQIFIFTIIILFVLQFPQCSNPSVSNDEIIIPEDTVITGWWKITVRKGNNKWFRGTKRAFIKISPDQKKFTFGSIYEDEWFVEGTFEKNIEESNK